MKILLMIIPFSLVAVLLKLLSEVLKKICLNRFNGCECIKISSCVVWLRFY